MTNAKDMMLRDYFAGQILVALVSKLPIIDQTGQFGRKIEDKIAYNNDIADSCYQMADAMLERRKIQ